MKKLFVGSNLLRSSSFFKISVFVSISVACFFLGKHWSEDGFRRLVFFSSEPSRSPIVALSPDLGKSYNISDLIHKSLPIPPVLPPPLTPPPPPSTVDLQVFGIVDENGTMSDEFRIGDYDAESLGNQTESESGDGEAELTTARASVGRIEVCPEVMTDYIPCLDNVEAIKRLESTARGERFERHCPKEGTGLNCTVPAPNGYRPPIPWPKSRDEVWFNNVPHTRLVEDKGGQNWILEENDKFKFPGGGTQFIHGADQYLDQISQMVPDVSFGNHTRVVLDIGCGVASFGAYLMSRDVLTLSIAPKDVHENQIQFALERGVPAMVAAFTTRRLLYPSQAFDLVHCSRCRINWTRDDGILLLEVNRMLRAGGYFVWAAQPVYKHEKALEEQWEEMLNLTTRLCWVLVKKEGYIAIWQKPTNNTCYLSRDAGIIPPLCNPEDDPDSVWYVDLKACITRIEDNGYGANLAPWPSRLQTPPDRLQTIQIDSYIARKELFVAEYKYWKEIISNYVNALHWKQIGLRNVMDMRAGYGGFAAALAELKVDCWVLNVVPVSGANTLPVIYDRGLLGVMHDWCEPFDTYPRTYDLLHAAGLFSIERKRCNMTTIMLEMDRILRPGGRVYIRDTINVMSELQEIGNAMRWHEKLRKSYDHLYRNISSLAEALDMQPPIMPEDGTTRLTAGDEASSPGAVKDTSVPEPVWDDEETKTFYECLPDLRAFVPAVLLGEVEPAKTKNKSSESSSEVVESQQTAEDTTEFPADSGNMADVSTTEQPKEKDDVDKEKAKGAKKEKGKEKDSDKKLENEKEKGKSLDVANFERLLQRLPGCVSRDLIDQLTVEYCYLNSKTNRKKLVKALFNVPRTSLELLAYYSRMIATLATCMKDIPSTIVQMLEEEFNYLVHKKDQMNIESKIRNIRFIGELCKFKIVPSGLVFSCLKACLDDFTHHNIDVACNLLETCGRFLYRSPETTLRMTNMLDILMRLKNVKNLDPRQSTLVENAYYLCKPPERSARISKVRPPLHQYIRKLLFSDLDKDSITNVLKQLRKLPWSECEQYILKCFMKVHKGKYGQIHLIASLTSGLSRHHEEFAVAIVDEVLEEIRVGLELNEYGAQQKRLAHMRFLGELYNYEHVDSSVIFETLYLTLSYGHGTSEQEVLDPPEDFFRVRMVIILLETCGHYFDRGSSKKRLDQFLVHFQRYTLSKGHLPLDIEFDLQDLFANLRPNMTRYTTIDEINAAILQLEEREHASAADKVSVERHPDTKRPGMFSNGKSNEKNIGENGEAPKEESDSDSGSGSAVRDGQNEELDDGNHERGSDSDDGDDYEDGVGPGSDDDNEFRVRQKVVTVDPEEQADFDQELKALLQESIEQRKLELRGRPALNMTIPMSVFEGSGKDHHHFGRVTGDNGEEVVDEENGEPREVQVKVLVKRGNKQQTKQMLIPSDCSLVQSTKQKEAADLEEKQDIKRLVLEYNERDEEEANGLGTQASNWIPGGSRGNTRSTGEGSGKGGGSRHRFVYHQGGGGSYYSRRK